MEPEAEATKISEDRAGLGVMLTDGCEGRPLLVTFLCRVFIIPSVSVTERVTV